MLVENVAPGVMARRGLGYDDLRGLNPRLVYASITGYGSDGPDRDRAAIDPIVQALSGLMAKTGFADGPPTRSGAPLGDQVRGIWTALGVLAALRQRDLDGEGQFVDVAMLDALVALMWDEPLDQYDESGMAERVANGDPRGAPFDTYAVQDGWVAIAAPATRQWKRLQPLLSGAALDAVGIPAGPVNPPWWARTDWAMREVLGLDRAQIAALDDAGAFAKASVS